MKKVACVVKPSEIVEGVVPSVGRFKLGDLKKTNNGRTIFPFEFYNILNYFICSNYDFQNKSSVFLVDDFINALVNASDIERDIFVSVVRIDSLIHKANKCGWSVKRVNSVVGDKSCVGFVFTDVEQDQVNKKLEAVERKSKEKKFVDRVPQFWSLECVGNWEGCCD
jgi:hypothetical protein